ncbi:hypothetical protein PVMG_04575 [Plasmodium vivax Mauritania I]|uniref:Uncharacterized protein n=1 Tax=Plasmodium vivax Mauritania I TaxID=1035515 RepID=A0A0J9T2V6_PLAVI|nr:hypothetical protein PVMG_04575 [Plasmodium vivax Mauritania I]
MSPNKLDIEQLRKDVCFNYFICQYNIYFAFFKYYVMDIIKIYPFLKNIWKLYEEFEREVDDEGKSLDYENICKAKLGRKDMKKEKYVNFCIKLIRNLVPYPDIAKAYTPGQERCNSLNYWIYYNIEDLKLTQNFINDIFTESKGLINGHKNKSICPISYIETLKESEKIIKLLYLQDNTDIFLETLKDIGSKDYCSCEKFVNECVKIYKDMKSQYCTQGDDKGINSETCSHLGIFNTIYTNFLFNKPQVRGKIPSLTSANDEYVGRCKTEQIDPNPISIQQNNPGTSQEFTVKTTVATMAGASSVLALLYKVNISLYIYIYI